MNQLLQHSRKGRNAWIPTAIGIAALIALLRVHGLGQDLMAKWQASDVLIEWTLGGRLESAETLAGPWVELTGASSPLRIAPSAQSRFYRLRLLVELRIPTEPLFIGGWTKVPLNIVDPTIAFGDLDFTVEPAHSAATVSSSRDESFDPSRPDVTLIAGWRSGDHTLIATHRPTARKVGSATFHVTDTWLDPDKGPSLSVIGSVEAGPSGGTWGGGDFTKPQNVEVSPALGTRGVALVLVDTASARYPTGAALTAIVTGLWNEMVNGVPVNGQNRSVAAYFSQASEGAFGINVVGVVGPVSLPAVWTNYFTGTPQDSDGDGVNDWTRWSAVPTFASTVIADIVSRNVLAALAGNPPFLDLSQVDSLIYVVRSTPPTAAMAGSFVWPRASFRSETQIIGWSRFGSWVVPSIRAIAQVTMPDDWDTQPGSGRRWHETTAHELGHNLQLDDQYFQDGTHDESYRNRIADANPAQSWELMAWEEDLPLPSAAHRLMLGWLKPVNVHLFNFGVFGPVDRTIVLQAASSGTLPPGRFSAAEVRIADGENYYFEYRPSTTGRIVDPNPPAGDTVFGSHATSRGSTPANRPNILRIANDVDMDRGEFQSEDDHVEADTSSPDFPNDFVLDVLGTTSDSATIRVRYGQDQKPDPALTPWSAASNWQSPDIEVSNGRSRADPTFRNIPWEGHDNTIVARVRNGGQIPAAGVRTRFFVKDFTFAGGSEAPLGDAVASINNGTTVSFTAPAQWRPAQIKILFPFALFTLPVAYPQHACVVARIDPYIVGALREVTPDNNEAQSNYSWLATTTSSPASREVTVIIAENTLPRPAIVSFQIHQPNPLFRVYLNHRWVRLAPGAKAPILVMIESLLGDPRYADLVKEHQQGEQRVTSTVRISALGDTGEACAPTVLGGATILAITGRATRFDAFTANVDMAQGTVVAADTGAGVDGKILISIRNADPNDPAPEIIKEGFVQSGAFQVLLNSIPPGSVVQGHYLGQNQMAPSDSQPVTATP